MQHAGHSFYRGSTLCIIYKHRLPTPGPFGLQHSCHRRGPSVIRSDIAAAKHSKACVAGSARVIFVIVRGFDLSTSQFHVSNQLFALHVCSLVNTFYLPQSQDLHGWWFVSTIRRRADLHCAIYTRRHFYRHLCRPHYSTSIHSFFEDSILTQSFVLSLIAIPSLPSCSLTSCPQMSVLHKEPVRSRRRRGFPTM